MKWRKLGRIFEPAPVHPDLLSHAANPLPIHLEGDIYRVLYSGRNSENRSSVGFFDLDVVQRKVVNVHQRPVFRFGPEGSFYSHGVSIGNCYEANGQRFILFMGWQVREGEHWRGDIGRLTLSDDWTLSLADESAYMTTDSLDSVSLSYPFVLKVGDGSFVMWYGSTTVWDAGNGEMVHVINYARSQDGEQWDKKGIAIPYELNVAQAFSRPTVLVADSGFYEMWFSYRSGTGEKYRIGYAKSADGAHWVRALDETGITVSPEGWDSEMICYPFVFEHKGEQIMLYNGNGYGKTGVGLAIRE
ncbi:MAG: hypothetical protein F9K24_07280 [Leptonema illini]|uniref:Glycosyl hydrolase family 32 N-terminal domain-containing protein n=1 Tax=Leptonema illini TaxID=183 RepID=A0A833H2W3_9LEPT|nr:MAG: hypothetical protein F9K24_07280 [Leptonema illini]